jgi:hypothetical protein
MRSAGVSATLASCVEKRFTFKKRSSAAEFERARTVDLKKVPE